MSLVSEKDAPKLEAGLDISHLCCPIEDNPYEDLLGLLDGLCDWIDYIRSTTQEPRILVHCVQGISRSGAVVIAYLMRSHRLNYEEALSAAQGSRRIIAPNSGFVDQLRLWLELEYSVLDGGQHKAQYDEWKDSRGILLTQQQREARQVTEDKIKQFAIRSKSTI